MDSISDIVGQLIDSRFKELNSQILSFLEAHASAIYDTVDERI